MKTKTFKILLAIMLIVALTGLDLVFLGDRVIGAISDQLNKNILFDAYFETEDGNNHSTEAMIHDGSKIVFTIEVNNIGVLNDAKIKLNDSNFRLQPVESQYIKNINVDANEIELNQIIVGNPVKIEIPVQFENTNEMSNEYLDRVTNVELTGKYENNNQTEQVSGKTEVAIHWKENVEIVLNQDIEKYVELEEKTLIQQKISSQIVNNMIAKGELVQTVPPAINDIFPESVEILLNGDKLEKDKYSYKQQENLIKIENNYQRNRREQNEYKIIYTYPTILKEEKPKLLLSTNIEAQLYAESNINKQEDKEVEVQKTDNIISVISESVNNVNKGFLYSKVNRNTEYQDNVKIEISSIEQADEIMINNIEDNFIDVTDKKHTVNNSTKIQNIQLNKSNLQNVLGDEFEVEIVGDENVLIQRVNKNSNWKEDNTIQVDCSENNINNIRINISTPVQIGTLSLKIEKYIQSNTGYEKETLKTFKALENAKIVNIKEKQIQVISNTNLQDTKTEANLKVNNTKLSILDKNEDVQIFAILKSDNNQYDLYKNPYIEIKLPEELQEININSIHVLYADEMAVSEAVYEDTTKTIKLRLQGEQSDYKTELEEGIQIVISANLTFQKNISDRDVTISMVYTNENGNEAQYETSTNVSLGTKYGAILYNNISGYNAENTVIETVEEGDVKARLDSESEAKQAQINQTFINNYDCPIDKITILGSLKGEKSNFNANLVQNVNVNNSNAKVFYSNKENAPATDETWQENIENLQEVKSYKIELAQELAPTSSMDINYQLSIPENLAKGAQNQQTTKVLYSYQGQELSTFSNIDLETEKIVADQGIETEVIATSGNKQLQEGDGVFEGQAITYTVKVKNNSGEDISNLQMTAEHDNAIFYVKKLVEIRNNLTPDQDYREVTQKDENTQNITQTQETLKNGETAIFTYQVSAHKKVGNATSGTIKIKAENMVEKSINTITNTINDGKLEIEILNTLDEREDLYEKDIFQFLTKVTNKTEGILQDVEVKMEIPELLDASTVEEFGWEGLVIEDNILTIKIDSLDSGKSYETTLPFKVKEISTSKTRDTVKIYATSQIGDEAYYSNTLERDAVRINTKLEINQKMEKIEASDDTEDEEITKLGDKFRYTLEITSNETELEAYNMKFEHVVTKENSKIENATLNGQALELTDESNNTVNIGTLTPGQKVVYTAEILLCNNPDKSVGYLPTFQNNVTLYWNVSNVLNLEEIAKDITLDRPVLPPSEEDPGGDSGNEQEEGGNKDPEKEETKKYSISGIAWVDENKNGIREENEGILENIEVQLLNTDTEKIIQNTKTDKSGSYKFDNITKGNYIVLFTYNSAQYKVTQYKQEDAKETNNSDVIQKEINKKMYAATDSLVISNKNLENIDAGFVKNAKFDFSLEKSITKVIVQNDEGTKVVGYDKTQLAKIEINSKYVANTLVVVEYNIQIKNEGEIEGYASDIVDYMPKDLSFSSEMNKDWYIGTDGNLHNVTLQKTAIKPGETKQLSLVLTKKMTTENMGNTLNIAEIASTSNILSALDEDSTPNNRKDNEDDISSAELIISLKTGMATTISIGAIGIIILAIIAYIIYKKRKGGEINEN